ncbi:MAG: superoxide dismutase family protein [Clostridia bacterium]|nr:superoxide dismutase family protein [Clostridia bacterium]
MYIGRKNSNHIQQSVTAKAAVMGSKDYPALHGTVTLRQMKNGVLVTAEIFGLPSKQDKCDGGVFGFHIHEGTQCSGNEKDPFADAKMHFNPDGCPHPYHAGDLPPLFGNNGYAYLSVFTNRFRVDEVIGRVIIIHSKPDDFTTQPSGNSGAKIACGKIRKQ